MKCTFRDGSPVIGAKLVAYNMSTWQEDIKKWLASTGTDGAYTFHSLDRGFGDKYDFEVEYLSEDGILYLGEASDKIRKDMNVNIIVRVAYPSEIGSFEIPEVVLQVLESEAGGAVIISALKEFARALSSRMIHGSLALSTYVLEGMMKIVSGKRGIWKQEYDVMTFGDLINKKELAPIFPKGMLDKVKGLNKFRIGAVHFTGTGSALAESQVAAAIVKDLLIEWTSELYNQSQSQDHIGVEFQGKTGSNLT